jgi:Tfp pilus assembly protein PilE
MRLLRVRFTIQRMMVVMAAIAIIGGMLYRSYQHRRTAEYHRIAAEKAAVAQKVAIWKATIAERFNDKSAGMRYSSLAEWIGRVGSFHSALRRKYTQAARTPWRFLEPDPPSPRAPEV